MLESAVEDVSSTPVIAARSEALVWRAILRCSHFDPVRLSSASSAVIDSPLADIDQYRLDSSFYLPDAKSFPQSA